MGVWYFAYGSNMQSATLRERRGVTVQRALPARLAGWRLVFDKPALLGGRQSFANVVPDAGSDVIGVAFEVSADDLRHIERTEGVELGNYASAEVEVVPLADGEPPLSAITLTSERRDPTRRPSTRYVDLVVAGAAEHGLPAAWIAFLRSIPAEPEDDEAARLRPLLDRFMRTRR